MLRIHNPRGPHQCPKITKNTPNIDAFTLAPLKHYKNHALAAINSYQSPASSNLIHIKGGCAAPLKSLKSCCNNLKFFPAPSVLLHPISATSREATPYICYPRGPHQRPKLTKNITKILITPCTFEKGE